MTTLLESRTHYHHLRVLSQKAQESLTHDEELSKRWSPAVPPDSLSTNDDISESLIMRRQCSQQLQLVMCIAWPQAKSQAKPRWYKPSQAKPDVMAWSWLWPGFRFWKPKPSQQATALNAGSGQGITKFHTRIASMLETEGHLHSFIIVSLYLIA
jgi:hypothetical protein